ncbi:hypothetical protein TraAM80_05751 [Trypanosoma rangeli]|uniref:RanBP2-type domain-containing protein n=1 Tax=Trypanosoma rangeli TaxID=5698 RepID=A0A3R7NB72_TRYRA|nr:uncharacterized protein TraAM80_05751 [Trypanosoma rangeli]RNF03591.1 hypothetical protein TraAM80_05751 [Trypanosoma rangeli]|eukprot:RNF03591.1 hypothetical protein TraAM80_05751 [Trypanosoma rangeli]
MLRKPLGSAKKRFLMRRFRPAGDVCRNALTNDMALVIRADCEDTVLSPLALTTSAELVQRSPEALLNNANRPLHVILLLLLHRRGVLDNKHTRQEIARFLVPSVHLDWLPWLWGDDGESVSSSSTGDISALRTLPPVAWWGLIEQEKPSDPSDQLHYWHQVFFALSANPAFTETVTFDSAHRELLTMVREYYIDVTRVQKLLPPLKDGTILTRMPPVLLRKLRKLYVEQYRLVQYAELFRAVVDGEELAMPEDGTALLHDAELFEYYLTIPGRRESGMERERRWTCTLEYAVFAFHNLFRQQRWTGDTVNTALSRPVTLLMNICVFSKNDNAEGYRYREAILSVMHLFHTWCRNGGDGKVDCDVSSDTAWELLRLLRDTGVESMLAKCKRLHFGPMRGLLDVCTVAVVTEMLLCLEADAGSENVKRAFRHEELEILLSPRKLIGSEMYDAMKSHDHSCFAARYGLLNLGARINAALEAVVKLPESMQRYTAELEKWGAFIGRPLRLSIRDISSSHLLAAPLMLDHVGGKSVPSWQCGCRKVNPVQAMNVSCIGCVSRDLVEHEWTCPHCSWISASGDYMDTCLGCHRPHPCRQILADGVDVTPGSKELPVTPFLWYCEGCFAYSPLAGGDAAAGGGSCSDCDLGGKGWSTSFFEWRCGCGEVNSPLRRWCWACSVKRNHAACCCVTCGKEWKLQPRHRLATSAVGDICPSCNGIHPRDVAARQRRLLRCPFCHWLTRIDDERCQNCKQCIGVLRQFLAGLPDCPWSCHVCGCQHHHRDTEGALYPPWRESIEACGGCDAPRVDPVLFGMHETWVCESCRGQLVRGFNCPRCLSLHPAIAGVEVHAWRCVVCLSVNNSWDALCQRRGCGTRRSADSTALPYSPWRCSRCGGHSRSAQVPQCEHCGTVRVAAYPAPESTVDAKRLGRLAEVEGILANAAAANDAKVPEMNLGSLPTDDWSRCLADSIRLAVPLG